MSEEEMKNYLKEMTKYEKNINGDDIVAINGALELIDKLQKENEDMREELQMYVDTDVMKLREENEELKEEIKHQYKQYIKDHTEVIENLKKEQELKIRTKIKELEEPDFSEYPIEKTIDILKELLGE